MRERQDPRSSTRAAVPNGSEDIRPSSLLIAHCLFDDLDDLPLLERPGGLENDRLARLDAGLDAGEVVTAGHGLDATFVNGRAPVNDPGEGVARLLDQG